MADWPARGLPGARPMADLCERSGERQSRMTLSLTGVCPFARITHLCQNNRQITRVKFFGREASRIARAGGTRLRRTPDMEPPPLPRGRGEIPPFPSSVLQFSGCTNL